MFDRYIIVEDTLRNVEDGFAFEARCGYYRRLILSMVEDLEVSVDERPVERERIRLRVAGRDWSLDEMRGEFTAAWEFGEPATLSVRGPALAPGTHRIGLAERLRISYLPGPHTPATTQEQEVAA